jgi:hypothetical protein
MTKVSQHKEHLVSMRLPEAEIALIDRGRERARPDENRLCQGGRRTRG